MIEFNEEKHEYIVDGVVVPSVTQITRYLHYDEASGANQWLRDEAAKKGSAVHEATVMIDYGDEPDDFPVEYAGYLKAYKNYLRDFKPQYSGIEKMLAYRIRQAHDQPLYAGTIDRYGFDNGIPFVLDIKTGTKLNHMAITAQLQGYCKLLFNNYGIMPVKTYALQLCKDGTYKLYREHSITKLFDLCQEIDQEKGLKGEKL